MNSLVPFIEDDFEDILEDVFAPIDADFRAEMPDEVWNGHHEVVEDERTHVDARNDLLVD